MALAFGLTLLTMVYAIGHISGCHINPAVSFGLWSSGDVSRVATCSAYVDSQILGGILGAAILYVIASGRQGFDTAAGFAANGYGEHSPGGYYLAACVIAEFVLTFAFLIIILGATEQARAAGLRGHRHRLQPDADPPHRHPGHQHLGQPGAEHRPGALCGGLGARAVVALLGRADRRRHRRRRDAQSSHA